MVAADVWTDRELEVLRRPALRSAIVDVAERSLDRRLVPLLLKGLGDAALRVRIEKVLDAMADRALREAMSRRLLEPASAGARAGLRGLVRRAQSASRREVQIAAIHALGPSKRSRRSRRSWR